MNRSVVYIVAVICFFLSDCNPYNKWQEIKQRATPERSMAVKYAKGFSVDYYGSYKVITVRDILKDSTVEEARYVLYKHSPIATAGNEITVNIIKPVRKVVCVSTTHMAEMVKLGLMDSIGGITNLALIYDSTIKAKVASGQIANLGNDEVNYEKLVQMAPSFVITSGGYDGGDKLKVKLASLNIKSVIDLDYKEQDPLARAEWIKFIAAFYDMEEVADSIFRDIETRYLALKEKTKNVSSKPTAFCNIPFKEVWYMPAGENYLAKLADDAGGDFMWKDAAATNGLNLNLDYEAVYAKAANADVWLNTGFANSLKEIESADKKNTFFKAYKQKTVYNNNLRNTPSGGFDFWESGLVNPDLVLADLIYIFHPELLPGHQFYYYQKLK